MEGMYDIQDGKMKMAYRLDVIIMKRLDNSIYRLYIYSSALLGISEAVTWSKRRAAE